MKVSLGKKNNIPQKTAAQLPAQKKNTAMHLPRFFSVLMGHNPIAGIAVVGDTLRAIVLDPVGNAGKVLTNIEIPLPQGTIVDGKLANIGTFSSALEKLRAKAKTPFCIFSLPGQGWWARIFFFPAALTNTQFEDAMQFHKTLDLPWEAKDVYADWSEITVNEADKRASIMFAAKMESVDPYITALVKAGWTALAVEPEAVSMVRAIAHFEAEDPALVFGFDGAVLQEMIVWKGEIHFGRIVSVAHVAGDASALDKQITSELKRLFSYAVTEPLGMPRPIKIFFLGSFSPEQLKGFSVISKNAGLVEKVFDISSLPWGAALRGLVSRDKDNFISLMPLGTEESYTRRRTALFVEFAFNFSLVVALAISVAFAGTWAFVRSQQQQTTAKLSGLVGNAAGLQILVNEVNEFNTVSAESAIIARVTPYWDDVYRKIMASSVEGIKIYKLTLNSSLAVQLSGTATHSDALLAFRSALMENNLGQDIKIPSNLFEEKENFDFQLSFMLPDRNILFD